MQTSSVGPGPAPGMQVDGADYKAENIGWNKACLRSSETNDADDDAVHRAQGPAFPATASH